jgi:hypothetical protein
MAKSIQLKDNDGNLYLPNQVYSTEETKIGVWIDGKPIYRKVFKPIVLEIGLAKYLGTSNLNISTMVSLKAIINDKSEGQWKIANQYWSSTDYLSINYSYKQNYIYYDNKGTSNGTIFFILEYTKTTDD